MDLLTRHFWKFFFGLVAIISAGILTIYISSFFDQREENSLRAENRKILEDFQKTHAENP